MTRAQAVSGAVGELRSLGLCEPFVAPVTSLMELGPSCVFVIGSRAGSQQLADELSDLDIVLAWPDSEFAGRLRQALHVVEADEGTVSAYLGPNVQFGHLVTLRDRSNPVKCVDLGLASEHFVSAFMPPCPMRVAHGTLPQRLCGAPVKRAAYLAHLLAQCIKAYVRGKRVYAVDYLARARTILLLARSAPSDFGGMSRRSICRDVEEEILANTGCLHVANSDIMQAVQYLLKAAESLHADTEGVDTMLQRHMCSEWPSSGRSSA